MGEKEEEKIKGISRKETIFSKLWQKNKVKVYWILISIISLTVAGSIALIYDVNYSLNTTFCVGTGCPDINAEQRNIGIIFIVTFALIFAIFYFVLRKYGKL